MIYIKDLRTRNLVFFLVDKNGVLDLRSNSHGALAFQHTPYERGNQDHYGMPETYIWSNMEAHEAKKYQKSKYSM